MNLLSYLSGHYYSVGIMVIMGIAAFITSIKYYHRHKALRIFTYYILLSLIQDSTVFFLYHPGNNRPVAQMIAGLVTNFFMLAEFLVFVYFILSFISSRKRRRIIWIDSIIFLAIVVRIWIRLPSFIYSGQLFLFESLFLVLPCLLYFYELLMHVDQKPLKEEPSFWIITGILFLNACSIPLLLTQSLLGKFSGVAFSLNYILYAILFLLLIRAYRCKPEPPGVRLE